MGYELDHRRQSRSPSPPSAEFDDAGLRAGSDADGAVLPDDIHIVLAADRHAPEAPHRAGQARFIELGAHRR